MAETLTLTDPLDMHVHLRDGAMLDTTVPLTAARFSGALAMPNLVPPLRSAEEAAAYRKRIEERCLGEAFRPYMTLFFHEGLTGAELERARREVLAVKLYPRRATTHSDYGVDLPLSKRALRVIESMEELGMVLCVHGETAGFVMDREREFVAVYDELSRLFPRLTIVMEHITTREAVELLVRRDNLHATITLHHLMLTLDDVVGGRIRPHNFCMPLPKTPADRDALAELAFAAHPRVMFGSDSAPHAREDKESCCGAAGVFSAPVALEALTELFEAAGRLDSLQPFVSENAKRIYAISPPKKTVRLVKDPWTVPELTGPAVPFLKGRTMMWRLDGVEPTAGQG